MNALVSRLFGFLGTARAALRDPHRFELAVAAIMVAATTLIALWFHVPLVTMNSDIGFDEGYAAGMALRILDGHGLPYVDAASHRGPLFYWTVTAASMLGGRYTWYGFRGLAFFAFFASLILMLLNGMAARKPLAGAFAALFYTFVMCFALIPEDGVGLHAEPLAVPWILGSLLFATLAVHHAATVKRFLVFAAASGACAMAAGLMKQTLLAVAAPVGIWLLADVITRAGWSRRARVLGMGAFVGGWLLVGLLVLLPYAFAGELRTFYYWFWQYNADVFPKIGAPRQILRRWYFDEPWLGLALFVPLVISLGHSIGRAAGEGWSLRGYARYGFDATAALVMLYALAAALAGLRLWPHYFIVTLAFTGLVVGVGVNQRFDFRRRAGRRGAVVAALLSVPLVASSVYLRVNTIDRERKEGRGWVASVNADVCRFVQEHTAPQDPIFVWGFDADLYVDCARRPASKFVYMTLVLGTVPPMWYDRKPELVARDAEKDLLGELTSVKPRVVLDLTKRIHGFSMTDVTSLKGFLTEGYCRMKPIAVEDGREATPYLRKDLIDECPQLAPKKKAKAEKKAAALVAPGR